MFRKKKSKRLYIPTKSKWYTRPRRRRPTVRRSTFSVAKTVRDFVDRFPYLLFFGAVFVVIFFIFALSSYFLIKDVEVVRKSFNVDSASIENELKDYIGQNIFFISRRSVYQTIHEQFPEFETIQVRKIFPDKLSVDLESYPMVANLKIYYSIPEKDILETNDFDELNKAIEDLSDEDPDLALSTNPLDEPAVEGVFNLDGEANAPEISEQKALLNQVGQAIFDQDENLELITIVIRGLLAPVEDRQQVISYDHMTYLNDMMQYFSSQMSLVVDSLEYLPIPREARIRTENNLVLWVSVDRPYEDQIDKLRTIYEPAELNKEDIAYIDLRIKEKVIYCPRGASCDK